MILFENYVNVTENSCSSGTEQKGPSFAIVCYTKKLSILSP